MKSFYRILSGSLAALMLCCCLGTAAFATGTSGTGSGIEVTASGNAQIIDYSMTDAKGKPITGTIPSGSKFNLTINIFDSDVTGAFDVSKDISVKLNSAAFSCPAGGSVSAWAVDGLGSGAAYCVTFKDVTFLGGEGVFQFDLSYPTKPSIPIQHKSLTFNNVVTLPESTPAPAPTPVPNSTGSAQIANYQIADLSGNPISGTIKPGDHFALRVYIRDPANTETKKLTDVKVRLNSSSFTSTAEGEVNDWWTEGFDTSKDHNIQQYWVLFRDITYTGGEGSLGLDVSYATNPNLPVQHLEIALNNASSGHTPGLIVQEANYGGQVVAGQPFTLTLTLFSSIGEESLTDVIVSLNLPEDVSLVSSKQSIRIPSMAPRSTATASFQLTTAANIAASVANIGVNMNATGSSSYAAVGASGSVSIPISQPERFEITGLEAPGTILMGEEQYISVTYVNKGKREISNLSASISGDNLANPGQSQYLGNVPSGTEKSVEFAVMANQPGTLNGTVTLTYENTKGEEVSLTRDYSLTVEEMPVWDEPMFDDPMVPEEPQSGGIPVFVLILGGAVLVIAVIVVVRVVKKKKAAKAAEKELLEEDDTAEDEYQPIPPAGSRKEN